MDLLSLVGNIRGDRVQALVEEHFGNHVTTSPIASESERSRTFSVARNSGK